LVAVLTACAKQRTNSSELGRLGVEAERVGVKPRCRAILRHKPVVQMTWQAHLDCGNVEAWGCAYLCCLDRGTGGPEARHRGKGKCELHGASVDLHNPRSRSREKTLRSPFPMVGARHIEDGEPGVVRGAIYRPS
jgi:hypothetical protein